MYTYTTRTINNIYQICLCYQNTQNIWQQSSSSFSSSSSSNIFSVTIVKSSLFTRAVIDLKIGKVLILVLPTLLEESEDIKWEIAHGNEIGSLAQGVGTQILTGTNTILFTLHDNKINNTKVAYIHIVCADWPKKRNKTKQVCWTVNGNHINYNGNLAPPPPSILWQSSDFYLGTLMKEY